MCARNSTILTSDKLFSQEDSIPEGCVLPAFQPYVFWWSPLGVGTSWGESLREQVWTGLQWLPSNVSSRVVSHVLEGGVPRGLGRYPGLMSRGGTLPYDLFMMSGCHLTTPLPPKREQRDACENIILPKLCFRPVIINNQQLIFHNLKLSTKWNFTDL